MSTAAVLSPFGAGGSSPTAVNMGMTTNLTTTTVPQNYEAFFGPAPSISEVQRFNQVNMVTSHTLPDAYRGRSLHMADTMADIVIDTDEWPTIVIPWT